MCEFSYAESVKLIPDLEDVSGPKGAELSRTPIELQNGYWSLKIVPWIGGRIISMVHLPSGIAIYPKILSFRLVGFICT